MIQRRKAWTAGSFSSFRAHSPKGDDRIERMPQQKPNGLVAVQADIISVVTLSSLFDASMENAPVENAPVETSEGDAVEQFVEPVVDGLTVRSLTGMLIRGRDSCRV